MRPTSLRALFLGIKSFEKGVAPRFNRKPAIQSQRFPYLKRLQVFGIESCQITTDMWRIYRIPEGLRSVPAVSPQLAVDSSSLELSDEA